MAEAIAVLITAVAGLVTVLWKMVMDNRNFRKELLAETKVVKNEVQNSHNINLRDDLDNKHSEILDWLKRYDARMTGIEDRLAHEREAREKGDDTVAKQQARIWRAINGIERKGYRERNRQT